MEKEMHQQVVQDGIKKAMDAMFPYGAGRASDTIVRHHLETIAQRAFEQGRIYGLTGIMTVAEVAEHFNITERRARALILNRHERFGVGAKVGNQWLIHRDELGQIAPDEKYRA